MCRSSMLYWSYTLLSDANRNLMLDRSFSSKLILNFSSNCPFSALKCALA